MRRDKSCFLLSILRVVSTFLPCKRLSLKNGYLMVPFGATFLFYRVIYVSADITVVDNFYSYSKFILFVNIGLESRQCRVFSVDGGILFFSVKPYFYFIKCNL